MIEEYRKQFNNAFSTVKYQEIKDFIKQNTGFETGFRISESPIFLSKELKMKIEDACEAIILQIKNMSDEELSKAIPKNSFVPNDTKRPHFIAIDFGICKNENHEIEPQLIELQAFPSLFGFQKFYENALVHTYPFIDKLKQKISYPEYVKKLKEIIIADENPENVILLEIYPERQKTYIDFVVTEKMLGIKTICLTKVKKNGNKLYYENDGQLIPINRIYNRVIFDELDKIKNLKTDFDFRDELDVEWVTHPNWFFKISKYILPKLNHPYVPKSYFLSDFPADEALSDYVLKPLFSFAGSGVDLYPSAETIDNIKDKENYIMQRKVEYAPLFEDINTDFSKAEIRMLYIWNPNTDEVDFMVNLTRMTKVEMVNVDFNKKDAIWIGSSMAFFEE